MAVKWHAAYHTLASALSAFFENHRSSPSLSFYELCSSGLDKASLGWLNRLGSDTGEYGIDPIQIFSYFNDPNAKPALRTTRLKAFADLLKVAIPEELDFTGCPTMFNIKVAARRPVSVQDLIWEVMSDAVKKKQDALTPGLFGAIKGWYGINITSFTVFLFWIDAHFFLPADQHTVAYLKEKGFIKARPKNYSEYLEILNNLKIRDYPTIVERAVVISMLESHKRSEDSQQENIQKVQKRLKPPIEKPSDVTKTTVWDGAKQIQGCRLLGIRVYKETVPQLRKVIGRQGQMFSFYKAFSFRERYNKYKDNNDQQISYDPFKDVPLYQSERLRIHISAVVGENGSGKSTLIELILQVINNFTKVYTPIKSDLLRVEGLYVDIFFITDALYKLSIQGESYNLQQYERTGNMFTISKTITLLDFDFDQFFYNVVTNYALYALNSKQVGPWVEKLFHKNDQYQVPINISPYRQEGNININKENGLMITRLVSNLLLPVEKGKHQTQTIRRLTTSKTAEVLRLNLDSSKLRYLYEFPEKNFLPFEAAAGYWYKILSAVKKAFTIKQHLPEKPLSEPLTYTDASWMYLMKKIISICRTYPEFRIFFDERTNTFNLDLIEGLINGLKRQKSHVTHKFYQVINFLNENHLDLIKTHTHLKEEIDYDIDDLSVVIEKKVLNAEDNAIKTIHFAPPAFLRTGIRLTGDVSIHDLSSGEKQRIYTVSSVLYHLINIDSNADLDELIRYSGANVVFEEVELYFHPEMQRTFISYFLNYLSRVQFDVISSINVIFVTHSPFILSDIPADNIIFMGDTDPGIRTFGANIHTMLAESFFLKDGFMGEYAKDKVNDLIGFLVGEANTNGEWDVNSSAAVINAIGEPLLKNRLLDIYRKKFDVRNNRQERIAALYNQIKTIENEED